MNKAYQRKHVTTEIILNAIADGGTTSRYVWDVMDYIQELLDGVPQKVIASALQRDDDRGWIHYYGFVMMTDKGMAKWLGMYWHNKEERMIL